ncbi:MAG TPA: hypothetical protein PLU49_12800 [Saprospiraceae bacterium]|nr:hypothetical protein [Saprospiraceae bacterium]
MSKFRILTDDGLNFELSETDIEQLDILENQDGTYSLIQNGNSYNIEIIRKDYLNKKYVLRVNEKEIGLNLKNELDVQIEQMGYIDKVGISGGTLYSPMPGLVIKNNVRIGDEVEKGDALIVLEAMKMENIIKAPLKGVIKSVFVKEGDSVLKKQVLLEIV